MKLLVIVFDEVFFLVLHHFYPFGKESLYSVSVAFYWLASKPLETFLMRVSFCVSLLSSDIQASVYNIQTSTKMLQTILQTTRNRLRCRQKFHHQNSFPTLESTGSKPFSIINHWKTTDISKFHHHLSSI